MGEREVLAAMLEVDADLLAERGGILLIADKGFAGAAFEKELAELGITLLHPARMSEPGRSGEPMLKKVRQLIESVNDTLKRPAGPGVPRWPDQRRRRGPRRPARPGPGRRGLVQQHDRSPGHPLTYRLRSLSTSEQLV